MATHMKTNIEINGTDYTSALVSPTQSAAMLDEQLDAAEVTLQYIRRERPFTPLTPVKITFTGERTYPNQSAQTLAPVTFEFLVADDTVEEQAAGNGFWKHALSLIEPTKDAEMFIGDSLTFTNDLGRSYTG